MAFSFFPFPSQPGRRDTKSSLSYLSFLRSSVRMMMLPITGPTLLTGPRLPVLKNMEACYVSIPFALVRASPAVFFHWRPRPDEDF
jgi:hypothetical protein